MPASHHIRLLQQISSERSLNMQISWPELSPCHMHMLSMSCRARPSCMRAYADASVSEVHRCLLPSNRVPCSRLYCRSSGVQSAFYLSEKLRLLSVAHCARSVGRGGFTPVTKQACISTFSQENSPSMQQLQLVWLGTCGAQFLQRKWDWEKRSKFSRLFSSKPIHTGTKSMKRTGICRTKCASSQSAQRSLFRRRRCGASGLMRLRHMLHRCVYIRTQATSRHLNIADELKRGVSGLVNTM